MAGWQSSSDLARRDRIDVTIVDDHHVITGAEKPSLKCLFDTDLRSEIGLDKFKAPFRVQDCKSFPTHRSILLNHVNHVCLYQSSL